MMSCSPLTLENKHLLSEWPAPLPKGQAGRARGSETGLSPALSKGLCPRCAERPVGQAAPNSAPLQHTTQTGLNGCIRPLCTLGLIFAHEGAENS